MNLIFIKNGNNREKVCIAQFAVNEMYSHICLRVFPVLWYFEKIYTTSVGTITAKERKLNEIVNVYD